MAKVWKVSGNLQSGGPVVVLPWERCRDLLKLDDLCRTEDRPQFESTNAFGVFTTHIVVSLDDTEANANGVAPGYFLSPLDPEIALRLLGATND